MYFALCKTRGMGIEERINQPKVPLLQWCALLYLSETLPGRYNISISSEWNKIMYKIPRCYFSITIYPSMEFSLRIVVGQIRSYLR